MLKFPRSIDEIDPLPELEGEYWYAFPCDVTQRACHQPWSKRGREDWEREEQAYFGEDWKPLLGKPYWHKNGKGQLRYAPPLPSNPKKDEIAYNKQSQQKIYGKFKQGDVVVVATSIFNAVFYIENIGIVSSAVETCNSPDGFYYFLSFNGIEDVKACWRSDELRLAE